MTIYPLERDRGNVCQMDKAIGHVTDDRYRELGAGLSLYNMQVQAGVWNMLQSMPLYYQYVDN